MKRVTLALLLILSGPLTGCETTHGPASPSSMKTYSYDSSLPIGKTNARDNIKIKNAIFLNTPSIPGLNIQTVVLNMQNDWGMKPMTPSIWTGWYMYDGGVKSDGISESYSVAWRSPQKVDTLHFSVFTNKSTNKLKAEAIKYLGYAATLPYTNAQPNTAKQWVISQLQDSSNKGKPVGTKIGQIYFLLYPYESTGKQMASELIISGGNDGLPSSIFK